MRDLPDGLTARPMTAKDPPAAAGLLAAAEPVDDTGEHLDAGTRATGLRQTHLGQLGVLRPARGSGIASAAIGAALRAAAAAGCDTAGRQVDTENPTGALGLYPRLGFAPVRTRVQWARTSPPVP